MKGLFKSSITFCILLIFILSTSLFVLPKPIKAEDTALRRVFVNTLYGLFTGTIIAVTLSIADGDAHGDDWARNIGIGGTIGAFIGAAYGMAQETRHFSLIESKKINLNIPLTAPSQLLKNRKSYKAYLNLLELRY